MLQVCQTSDPKGLWYAERWWKLGMLLPAVQLCFGRETCVAVEWSPLWRVHTAAEGSEPLPHVQRQDGLQYLEHICLNPLQVICGQHVT